MSAGRHPSGGGPTARPAGRHPDGGPTPAVGRAAGVAGRPAAGRRADDGPVG